MSTIHGFCSRVLRANALAAGSTPTTGCSPRSRPRGWPSTRSTARSPDSSARPRSRPAGARRRLHPDKLADMVRTATVGCAAGASARPRLEEMPAAERPSCVSARGGLGPALAELEQTWPSRPTRTRAQLERCPAVLEALGGPMSRRPRRARRAGAGALGDGAQGPGVSASLGAYGASPCAPPAGARTTTTSLLRDLMARYGRTTPGSRVGAGPGLRRPRAGGPRPPDRGRRRARRGAASASPRDGRRVPGHQPAAERAARAARTRQPVHRRRRAPVDLRLPARRRRGVPPPGEAARPRAGRADDRELPQPGRGARRGRPRPSRGCGATSSTPLPEPLDARSAAGSSRASSCW